MSIDKATLEVLQESSNPDISSQEMAPIFPEEILKTRLWVYQFLSQAFLKKPTRAALKDGTQENLFRTMLDMEEESPNNPGLSLLAETLERMPEWSLETWHGAQNEYQRLFYGPDSLPAKPWESVYLSRERIILDEHTLEVRAFYKKWGLETTQLNKEPEDHIGVELEFMADLTLRAFRLLLKEGADSDSWKPLLTAQQSFLENHLFKWVDQFCKLLSENTEHPLYKGIALFTPEFLHLDYDLLKDLTSQD